ncbi:hypothetical protein CPB86DRAFT_782081 [Serendipita vermifera]|nr:hypothetical protein CPB86DRAFT_782081 [Serendipita vermifera]
MSSNPTGTGTSNLEPGGATFQGNGQASNSAQLENGPCRNPTGHEEPRKVDPMQEGQDSLLTTYESRKGF